MGDPQSHDPDLRGLCAEVRELRAEHRGLEKLMEANDRRYTSDRDSDRARVDHAFSASEKASDRATQVSNEFRGQLADQADTFLRKEEALARLTAMDLRLSDVGSRLDRLEGRSSGIGVVAGVVIAIVMAGIGIATVVVTLIRHP